MSVNLPINIEQARNFLYNFDPDLNITFQLFDDTKTSPMARRYTGHFTWSLQDEKCIEYLTEANLAGCGIYFTINETDGKGRSESNIKTIRCLAADLDGAPLEPVLNCQIRPHYVIESSKGRYQCYWFIDPISIDDFGSFEEAKRSFKTWQVALARRFHSDESISDLSRVLRVPGFYHKKGAPFCTRIIEDNSGLSYNIEDLINTLDLRETVNSVAVELKKPLEEVSPLLKIKVGDRHATLLRYASKYAYIFKLSEEERWLLLQGINKNCCENPISDHDLKRINLQATRYAEDQKINSEKVDISGLINKHKGVSPNPDQTYDPMLYNPPGLVGEVMKYILSCSIKPQPELCLAAAFAACGALFGRKIKSESNLRTNVYFLSLIETGGGKDWPRKAIKKIFTAAGNPNRASVEAVTSDTAIAGSIEDCPSQVFLFDEFGRFLSSVNSKNAASHEIGIPTMLIKLYSAANETFNAKTFADKKLNKTIMQPNACVLATSVEANFYKNITKEAVDDGLLNRIILFKSANPDPAMRDIRHFEPPENVVKEFMEWEKIPYVRSGGNLSTAENIAVCPPEPMVVTYAEGAKEVFEQMESNLRSYRAELRKEGLAGLFTRCFENSVKIAMILAAGQNRESPSISVFDAEYATKLVLTTTNILLNEVRKKVSDSRVEASYKAVLMAIRDAGNEGITQKELGQKMRKFNIDKRQRDEIIKELESMGQISVETDRATSKRGTVSYKFVRE